MKGTKAKKAALMAAAPDDTASALSAPSMMAKASSKAKVVGVPNRP